ncbi:hypothetical protein [Aurantibacter sp.]|uniref:DUF7009 family protein n=1 Tax=Aurantibacter sp. TaxID=2807103 RepID=UPI0032651D6E
MKIRIKGNSIRYRLTQSDVKTFCENGYFEERTQFIENTFIYSIKISDLIDNIEGHFRSNKIELIISQTLLGEWATDEKVGFNFNYKLTNGEILSILIEKDFTCLDNTIEDQSDNYPNPKLQ